MCVILEIIEHSYKCCGMYGENTCILLIITMISLVNILSFHTVFHMVSTRPQNQFSTIVENCGKSQKRLYLKAFLICWQLLFISWQPSFIHNTPIFPQCGFFIHILSTFYFCGKVWKTQKSTY